MKKFTVRTVSFLAVVVCMLTFSMSAYALEFGVRGYYWFPDFSADIRVDKDQVVGTNISAEDDLGIGDESYPSVEAFAGIGKHHLSLMYTKADYSGEKYLSRTITFNGRDYTANAFVQSDLELDMFDLEYRYDILDLENILAGLSINLIGKIKYIDGKAALKAPDLGYDESESFKAPIPMIGVGVHVGILADILEARAKLTGIGYSGSKFYEGLADISVTPFPFLDIHGGYKFMKLDVDDISDVYADIEFKGPYLGLTVSF